MWISFLKSRPSEFWWRYSTRCSAGRAGTQAMMTTLAGLVAVLMIVVQEIASLFDMVKTLFNL